MRDPRNLSCGKQSHRACRKSTVHKDVTQTLKQVNKPLYLQVKEILDINKKERHLRGGEATRRKYHHDAE